MTYLKLPDLAKQIMLALARCSLTPMPFREMASTGEMGVFQNDTPDAEASYLPYAHASIPERTAKGRVPESDAIPGGFHQGPWRARE